MTRKDLNDNIRKNTEAVEAMKAMIAETPKKMLEAIPKSVNAEFCEDDRKRFDLFFKRMGCFVDWVIPCSVVVGIGGLVVLAAMSYSRRATTRRRWKPKLKSSRKPSTLTTT